MNYQMDNAFKRIHLQFLLIKQIIKIFKNMCPIIVQIATWHVPTQLTIFIQVA